MSEQRLVKIAVGQIKVAQGNTKENLETMLRMIDRAAAQGADLVVFPELAYTGYFLHGAEFQELAEPQDGYFVQTMCQKAKEKQIFLCAGYIEAGAVPGELYNSAVLISDEGTVLENMRKVYLWEKEKNKFCAGHRFPVVGTKLGRIGLTICYDMEYPEPARIECLKGAEMILNLAVWSTQAERRWHVDLAGNALFNLLFMVGSTMVGPNCCGCSKIVGPDGEVRAQASTDKEELLLHEIDLGEVIAVRSRIPYINDFKPETFSMEALKDF